MIVNDATRPTPSGRVIEIMADDLEGREVEFLVATGSHKVPGEHELEQIFGRTVRERYLERISSHDAKDDAELVHIGETISRRAGVDQPPRGRGPATSC